VRLRLVLPRRRRRRGLGRLTRRAALCAAAVALLLPGCGGGAKHRAAPARPIEIGITEANPHLIAPSDQPAAFAPWRDRLAALHPSYLRVLVDWARVQPSRDAPPDLAQGADGCLRGIPPCAPYGGIRDQLRAAKAAGMEVVVTFLGTPDWAAGGRCGRGRTAVPDLAAYRSLLRSLAALGDQEGVALRWWSPWNEPNNPDFLGQCNAYPGLAAAMADTLPPGARLVLGDAAGYDRSSPRTTGAADLAAGLPGALACAPGAVWAQHVYVRVDRHLAADAQRAPAGDVPLLDGVERALDSRGCAGPPAPLWITETGADPRDGAPGCVAMDAALRRWAADGRVAAAFQYTFRDDTAFPVGLADAGLTQLHPAYAAWLAWAAGRPAGDPCQPSGR
jgi:hypothetical protein